jgi:hypothetical protein
MSGKRPEWRDVKRYFQKRHYQIESDGGDHLIVAPKDGKPNRKRQKVRIGHRFSDTDNVELLNSHFAAIHRAFNVTKKMILDDSD